MWYSSNGLVALDLFSMFQFLVIILSSVLPIGWKVVITQYKHAISYSWQGANFTFGPIEQNQHFVELSQKSMFKHTRISAPKRFAKFGWQT